jgi:uncharacterized protein
MFDDFVWPQEHIARHGVTPDEFEQVCRGDSLIQKSKGKNPVYYARGQTEAGRYLVCLVIRFPDGRGYPITAREMDASEKRRFRKWRDQ